jgi:hypothetical protein
LSRYGPGAKTDPTHEHANEHERRNEPYLHRIPPKTESQRRSRTLKNGRFAALLAQACERLCFPIPNAEEDFRQRRGVADQRQLAETGLGYWLPLDDVRFIDAENTASG